MGICLLLDICPKHILQRKVICVWKNNILVRRERVPVYFATKRILTELWIACQCYKESLES